MTGVKTLMTRGVGAWIATAMVAGAQNDAADLRKELDALRGDYEKRISRLESRIRELESQPSERPSAGAARKPQPSKAPAVDEEVVAAQKREATALAALEALRSRTDETFREDTETRDIARNADAENMLAERIGDVLEGYVDIYGYFRAGYGRSDEGGPLRAFGAPGVAKYRLGNEAENYGELAFAKTFYPSGAFGGGPPGENDPVARMVYRMAFYNPYENYTAGSNTEFSSPELWGSLSNIIPGNPDAKIWAGSRYYRRHDIHMNDFFFWDMSGGGAGIEDFALGNGKLAFAWIGDGSESAIYGQLGDPDPLNLAGFSKTNFDLRYYDWAFLGGKGELGLTYATTNSGVDSNGKAAEDADGFALTLIRTDEGFLDKDSLHKLSLQLGNGPAKTFSSGFETFNDPTGTYIRPDSSESWRFRATDQLVVKPTDQLSLGTTLVYQYSEYGDGAPYQQWASAGVRPIWHFNDVFSLAFEGGFDWISDTPVTGGGHVTKLTLAPQASLGGQFMSRPVLRAFVTYASWSDGLQGNVGGPDYAGSTDGWSWGVQMETWW